MIIILLLIPLLCISFTLYIMSLYYFIINNDHNLLMILITVFVNIILSFFIIKIFIKTNEDIPSIMNLDKRSNLIHGYFSFINMFLYGISLIINSIIFKINIYNIITGIIIVILFIYITYEHVLRTDKIVLTLTGIDDTKKGLTCLYFCNNNDEMFEYYVKDNIYKEDANYLCKIGKSSKCIKKILKEVIEIE